MDPETKTDLCNATLIERIDVHRTLAIFRVRPDDGPVPDFAPGQFATLGFPDPTAAESVANSPRARARRRGPKLIRRAYSIASPATEKRYLEFYLVLVEDGKLTDMLWPMQAGEHLFMDRRIKGAFTLDGVPEGKDLVMVATGTGLAPLLSMYLTFRHAPRWNRFVLLEGCRYARDLAYHDRLMCMAQEDPTFVYLPTVTREPASAPWAGLRGRVHEILAPQRYRQLTGGELSPEHCHVFLCGNPAMIDESEKNLQQHGFVTQGIQDPHGTVHFERYW